MNKNNINHAMFSLLNFMEKHCELVSNYSPLIGISILNNTKISGIWAAEIDDTVIPWLEIDEALGHCYQKDSIVCIILIKGYPEDESQIDYAEIMHNTARYFLEIHGFSIHCYIHDFSSDNAFMNLDHQADEINLISQFTESYIDNDLKEKIRYQYFFVSSLVEFISRSGKLPQKKSDTAILHCAKYLEIELVRDALCENLYNSNQSAYQLLLTSIARIYPGTANSLLGLIAYAQGELAIAEQESLLGFYSFPQTHSFPGIVLKIISLRLPRELVQSHIELGSAHAKKKLEI